MSEIPETGPVPDGSGEGQEPGGGAAPGGSASWRVAVARRVPLPSYEALAAMGAVAVGSEVGADAGGGGAVRFGVSLAVGGACIAAAEGSRRLERRRAGAGKVQEKKDAGSGGSGKAGE